MYICSFVFPLCCGSDVHNELVDFQSVTWICAGGRGESAPSMPLEPTSAPDSAGRTVGSVTNRPRRIPEDVKN